MPYSQEFTLPEKPDLLFVVIGPHDPPAPEELTLGMGLVASAAMVEAWSTAEPIVIPPWPR